LAINVLDSPLLSSLFGFDFSRLVFYATRRRHQKGGPTVNNSFLDQFAPNIKFDYSCFDRVIIRGYIRFLFCRWCSQAAQGPGLQADDIRCHAHHDRPARIAYAVPIGQRQPIMLISTTRHNSACPHAIAKMPRKKCETCTQNPGWSSTVWA
jgi:hypothetical protein